jgi:nicotinamide riboside kinase
VTEKRDGATGAGLPLDEKLRQAYFWIVNTAIISPHYGRERWESKNGSLTYEDMLHIAERQVAAEDEASLQAKRFLFCDTSPLTTLF